jgi:hypothetical protein
MRNNQFGALLIRVMSHSLMLVNFFGLSFLVLSDVD